MSKTTLSPNFCLLENYETSLLSSSRKEALSDMSTCSGEDVVVITAESFKHYILVFSNKSSVRVIPISVFLGQVTPRKGPI